MAEVTIQQAFNLAVQHHQAGRLKEAEQLYRQILAHQPDHADALHMLAIVAHQVGQYDMALDLFRKAIAVNPNLAQAHCNLGVTLKAQGQLDQAMAAWRQAIVLQPDLAEAHNNLGLCLHDKGQLDQAIAAYRQAVALRPNYCDAYYNLGIALQAKQLWDQAIAAFGQAIAIKPEYAQAQYHLGVALQANGQLDRAIAAYRQAITLQPDNAEPYNNLGCALKDKGQLDEAVAVWQQAIVLKPDYPQVHNNLGNILSDNGQFDAAIASFEQAIRFKPDMADTHSNLASAYRGSGRDDLAEQHYRLAIQMNPAQASAYNKLGTILAERGDFQAAEDCYRQGIARGGNNAYSHANLAKLLGRRLPDKDLAALKELLADPSTKEANAACLHLALAYVLDARECYDEATKHLCIGNALFKEDAERKGKGYDAAAHAQFVTRMIATCSAEFFQRVHGLGLQTQRPIFVFGLPRSGTTLVEQILAAHSQVFGAGELLFGFDDFKSLAENSAQGPPLGDELEIAFQMLSKIDQQTLHRIAEKHLLRLDKLNSSAARIVDKMPENYLYLGLLSALFPQAKFIHCRRDWRDVAVSCWMTQFSNVPWCYDLEHIASKIEQYRRIMQHWHSVLNGRWLDCDYEQTVADLPVTARRLVDWCGLEWEPACVNYHLVKRPVRTASVTQVRQTIFNRSVKRWEHYRETLAPVLTRLS